MCFLRILIFTIINYHSDLKSLNFRRPTNLKYNEDRFSRFGFTYPFYGFLKTFFFVKKNENLSYFKPRFNSQNTSTFLQTVPSIHGMNFPVMLWVRITWMLSKTNSIDTGLIRNICVRYNFKYLVFDVMTRHKCHNRYQKQQQKNHKWLYMLMKENIKGPKAKLKAYSAIPKW